MGHRGQEMQDEPERRNDIFLTSALFLGDPARGETASVSVRSFTPLCLDVQYPVADLLLPSPTANRCGGGVQREKSPRQEDSARLLDRTT